MLNESDKYTVYMHVNPTNHKIYVGITCRPCQERWQNGLGYRRDQPVFYNAIKKYGWDGFEHIIFAENLTENEAKHMEILLIALYKTNCTKYRNPEYGYNMTDGGDIVGKCSEETKRKLSILAKKRLEDPTNHPMYGKHFSEDTRKKMSDAQKGKRIGESNSFYGKHHTEESIKKNKQSHKHESVPVIQLTLDGDVIAHFSSIHDAAKYTGVNRQCISFCLHGKYKSAGKYLWQFDEIK